MEFAYASFMHERSYWKMNLSMKKVAGYVTASISTTSEAHAVTMVERTLTSEVRQLVVHSSASSSLFRRRSSCETSNSNPGQSLAVVLTASTQSSLRPG